MPYKSSEAARKAQQRWYERNKDKHKANLKQRRKERAEWFVAYKSKCKCAKCGESHPACLEFHHPNDKLDKVSVMVHYALSEETILAEIAKCEVLCSNCHQKLHWCEHKGVT